MPSPSDRVCIIGFERDDEALVHFHKKHTGAGGMTHQIVGLPGCTSLTAAIFRAAALDPKVISLGGIGRTRRIEMDFYAGDNLRPRHWSYGKTGPSLPPANPTVTKDYAAMVAQLRWTDAREEILVGKVCKQGLDIFCEVVGTLQNQRKVSAMFYLLGILPGPSWPPDDRLTSLVKGCRAPAKILFTNAQAFRDSGYRVREDGSTSAAVEDLCGAVLASPSGLRNSNLTQEDCKVARKFFNRFTQIYIRIRCDAMLVFTEESGAAGTAAGAEESDTDTPARKWKVKLYYVIQGDRQAWFRYGDHIFGLNAIIVAVIIMDRAAFSAGRNVAPDAIREGICRAWNLVGRGYSIEADPEKWRTATALSLEKSWALWDPLGNEKGEWTPKMIEEGLKPENRVVTVPGDVQYGYVKQRSDLISLRPEAGPLTKKKRWDLAEHLLSEVRRRVGELTIEVEDRANIRYRNRWTFFREVCLYVAKAPAKATLWRTLPHRIARFGPERARWPEGQEHQIETGHEKLAWPYRVFRLGKVQSVDREEIDGLISLQGLIFNHLRACQSGEHRPEHPLCVGVFGAPGSGKSFGVKEIAKSLHAWGQPVPEDPVEFNVAQFSARDDLATALHKVRDLHLETKQIPVAIFDEFDATFEGRPFGWLGNFLMPMQDGKFVDRKDTFHTGPAIFIFAGGINHSFGEFNSRQRDRGFCEAKGPDFISRLRGIHNVPPLNRPPNFHEGSFPNWKIRRAILLHSSLRKRGVTIADDALLAAFLEVSAYHHGARSLGALIEMCALHHHKVIGRASLPPRDQLDLHVDAQEFWDLLRASGDS